MSMYGYDALRAARTRSLKLSSTVQIVDALSRLFFVLHYITLHYITLHSLHITLQLITLHYIRLHVITSSDSSNTSIKK